MPWQYLFSPFYVAPLLWLALLVAALVWLASRIFRMKSLASWSRLLAPISVFLALSSPLWLMPLIEEIQCRSAGLVLNAPVEGAATSIYWQSFTPNPNAYSLGVLPAQGDMGSQAMSELVRALAEGRLSAFEIPYEPVRPEVNESDRLNQRFFLAPSTGGFGKCLATRHFQQSRLPADTCIAFETSQGIQSRYEMRGHALGAANGRDSSIVDRLTGEVVASYKFVRLDTGETLLSRFGIRKLRPLTCTPSMTRTDFSTALIPIVFGTDVAPRVSADDLPSFRASTWKTISAPTEGEPVPEGAEGIAYLVAKGSIRQLTNEDSALWNRALKPEKPWFGVPSKAYLILGQMRLPDGLYGGHAVEWVIAEGARIPPGPRGHNTFYEVGKGCVWAANGCTR